MSSDNPPATQSAREAVGDVAVKAYGKYYLVRKLAEGGMAEIFLAKQVGVEGFERNVVVKRLLPHLSLVPDFVSMFLDEARLAASLMHPNIVQISDLGLADGCYFICMEYLPGEDFSAVLRLAKRRNQNAPLHVVMRVISEAASGLHYAHLATGPTGQPLHLVHRDVSPSNIFITYGGQVKLLDFGIAKAETRVTSTGTGVVKGKYQYMSPEQARSDVIDGRSDLYSLGVSLYEALTGVRPFARETDLGVLKAVLDGEYTPIRQLRPDLPSEVEQIVNRAMAFDADQRYATGLDMLQDIERFIGAATSASGGRALGDFMLGFFGEERVKSRTLIETLDQLAARGVDIPGRSNPKWRRTDPELPMPVDVLLDGLSSAVAVPTTAVTGTGTATATATATAAAAPTTVKQQARRRGVTVASALAAAVLVGVGGTIAATRYFSAEPQRGAADAARALPWFDAGTQESTIDAGTGELDAGIPVPADAGAQQVPADGPAARRVVLSTAMVQRALSVSRGKIQSCFQKYRDDLPTAQGTLTVNFVIAGSGKVTQVTTDLKGSKVSLCIERVVLNTRFPRHVDLEVRVPIALVWGGP